MKISILTLFPEAIQPYLDTSILARAIQKGLLEVRLINIRDFTLDKHRRVDDYPFGGGAGMVLGPQAVFDAFAHTARAHKAGCRKIYLSAQGRKLNNRIARELAQEDELILLCGHYEGVDQRIIDEWVDEEISIGDYVLTGGELAALTLVDSLSRFIPGVLGAENGASEESFESGLLEYPQYTRPADFRGLKVPEVLLGGDHAAITDFRHEKAMEKTRQARPDLLTGPWPMTALIRKAMQMVYEAQKDVPALFHAALLAGKMASEEEVLTALLHECDHSAEELKEQGFPEVVLSALELIRVSKPDNAILCAIREIELALKVKIADLQLHCDLSREERITPASIAKLKKNRAALDFLSGTHPKAELGCLDPQGNCYFRTREQVYIKVREAKIVSFLDDTGRWRPLEGGLELFADSISERYRILRKEMDEVISRKKT